MPKRRSVGRFFIALLAILAIPAVLLVPGTEAKKKKRQKPIPYSALPDWAVEAAGRQVADHDEAVTWLHDEYIVRPLAQGGVDYIRRVVGRAEKSAGIGAVDSFGIAYTEGDSIQLLRGWTLLTDETAIVTHAKDDVVDVPAVASAGFNDVRQRFVTASGVIVGSIVAFEAQWTEQMDTGMASFLFGSANNPTAYSHFQLDVPEGWSIETRVLRGESLEEDVQPTRRTWKAQDLAPLEDEELRPPSRDLLPRAWASWWSPDGVRGYQDWNAVAAWYREFSEPSLSDAGEAEQISASLAPSDQGALLDSLQKAYRFAAKDVRYVAIDLGVGIGAGYRPDPPATICRNRYGDCKDKTNLLRALAQPWNLKTYPVFVRTHSRGTYPDEIVSPSQFNHCIAAVALPDGVGENLWSAREVPGLGRLVFLDATVRNGSPWALRSDIQGTRAAVIHPEGGLLVDLPVQPANQAVTAIDFDVTIDGTGQISTGKLKESWSGTKATSIRGYYAGLTEDEQRRTVDENINSRFSGTKVTSYTLDGIDDVESPVVERTEIEGGRLAQRAGDLLIVQTDGVISSNWGLRLPKPPRRWPLNLGNPTSQQVEIRVRIPKGWKLEALPQSVQVQTEEVEAEAIWTEDEHGLLYKRKLEYRVRRVEPENYEAFREAMLQIGGADRQSLVLIPSSS